MQVQFATNRRLCVLLRILNQSLTPISVRKCSANVQIGSITKDVRTAEHPEFVPKKYCKLHLENYRAEF